MRGWLLRLGHQRGAACCTAGQDPLLQLLQLLLLKLRGVLAQQLQLLGRQHRPWRAWPCLLHQRLLPQLLSRARLSRNAS